MKVWIDIDNSPHVLFFTPIISELRRRGHEGIITARDCFQTCDLLNLKGFKYFKIGRHYGKNLFLKIYGLLIRAFQLFIFACGKDFSIAVSHGSRSMILAAFLLRIPIINIFDYEYSKFGLFLGSLPTKHLVPEFLPDDILRKQVKLSRVVRYPGLKEQIYIGNFKPDYSLLRKLRIDNKRVVITIRPPATEAHYHNPESERIFEAALHYLAKCENVVMVILPRTEKQKKEIFHLLKSARSRAKFIILEKTVNGPSLIWFSDAVISGGGTMNREAAVLNTPAYSIFKGNIGAVDRYLADLGKVTFISSSSEIKKIKIEKKKRRSVAIKSETTLDFIVKEILNTRR